MNSPAIVMTGLAMDAKSNEHKFHAEPAGESKAAHYRRLAEAHEREAAMCLSKEVREIQLRLAHSYLALAENEEWLDGKTAPHLPGGA